MIFTWTIRQLVHLFVSEHVPFFPHSRWQAFPLGKPLFEMSCFHIWALPVRAGLGDGGVVNGALELFGNNTFQKGASHSVATM